MHYILRLTDNIGSFKQQDMFLFSLPVLNYYRVLRRIFCFCHQKLTQNTVIFGGPGAMGADSSCRCVWCCGLGVRSATCHSPSLSLLSLLVCSLLCRFVSMRTKGQPKTGEITNTTRTAGFTSRRAIWRMYATTRLRLYAV